MTIPTRLFNDGYVHVNLRETPIDPSRNFTGWVTPIEGSQIPNAITTKYGEPGLEAVFVPKANVLLSRSRPARIGPGYYPRPEYVGKITRDSIRSNWTVDWKKVFKVSDSTAMANPRQTVASLLSTVLEPGDRVLDYDRATGEDFYRLYDVIHTDAPLNEQSLTEIEGMLDDKGVLCILAGEPPSGLEDHFKKWGKHRGMLMVQGPKNPEAARIAAEKERNS